MRKTREIGLLGALGGRPIHVAACFCAQGLFIGILGTGERPRPGVHRACLPQRRRALGRPRHPPRGGPEAILPIQRAALAHLRLDRRAHRGAHHRDFDACRDASRMAGRPPQARGGASQ